MKFSDFIFNALKTTDIQRYGANYEELSTDAALRAERIACQLRNLVYISDFTGKSTYMRLVADAHGIKIAQENEILSITLPGLLPKRKVRTNTAFLHEPLNYALQEYLKSHNLTLYRESRRAGNLSSISLIGIHGVYPCSEYGLTFRILAQ